MYGSGLRETPTRKAIREMTRNGISAGSRISGSKTPLFRLLDRSATQSAKGPHTSSATMVPTAGAKFENPIAAGEKLYGGFDRMGDSKSMSSRKAFAAPAVVQAAQHTMG